MKLVPNSWRKLTLLILVWLLSSAVLAEDVRVAVASNFYPTAITLKAAFEHDHEHQVLLSSGSTGKHYAQILQGAPFDLFLAADADRPARLAESGVGRADSLTSYALGNLLIWHPGAGSPEAVLENLRIGQGRVAIANPKLAPYGRAAKQTLDSLQLAESTQSRLVTGENIAQTFQFVASGNAKTGLVANAQLSAIGKSSPDVWPVPATMHDPIVQQMLLLTDARAAREFYQFMFTPTATEIIVAAGYSLPQ